MKHSNEIAQQRISIEHVPNSYQKGWQKNSWLRLPFIYWKYNNHKKSLTIPKIQKSEFLPKIQNFPKIKIFSNFFFLKKYKKIQKSKCFPGIRGSAVVVGVTGDLNVAGTRSPVQSIGVLPPCQPILLLTLLQGWAGHTLPAEVLSTQAMLLLMSDLIAQLKPLPPTVR